MPAIVSAMVVLGYLRCAILYLGLNAPWGLGATKTLVFPATFAVTNLTMYCAQPNVSSFFIIICVWFDLFN